jgi:hypothetical protein
VRVQVHDQNLHLRNTALIHHEGRVSQRRIEASSTRGLSNLIGNRAVGAFASRHFSLELRPGKHKGHNNEERKAAIYVDIHEWLEVEQQKRNECTPKVKSLASFLENGA